LIPNIEKFLPVSIFKMATTIPQRWNRTMLNLYDIVMAILKMEIARNFSMSGIYSGHHNLPTYEMSLKSHNTAKIQHCPISSKFDMWVDYDVPNLFPTLKNY
jgi:hypothetical protein